MKLVRLLIGGMEWVEKGRKIGLKSNPIGDTNYPSHTSTLHTYYESLIATSSIIFALISAMLMGGVEGTPPHAIKSYSIKNKLLTSYTICMYGGNGHTSLSPSSALTARSGSGVRLTMRL